MQKVKRLRVSLLPYRLVTIQTVLLLVAGFIIFTSPASAVIRFNNRSLFITDPTPGATTQYTISFTYNNTDVPTTTVGSMELLFCYDPIPSETISAQNPVDHHPCVKPAGLDVSHALLASQFGITGYSIASQTGNRIVLTRTPSAVTETPSVYSFDGIVNPTDTSQSFAIRMTSYASTDATGQIINLGSVVSEVTDGIFLETQVPPQLVFCLAHQVNLYCLGTSGGNYTDMGDLDPTQTLTASSQMAIGTNASGGYVVTANGTTMAAGTHVIENLTTPTVSAPGNSQFGINLVANSSPNLGEDPDGPFTNAAPAADYGIANKFTYRDGDVVAQAPNVSLMRRFTVSYILNSPANQRAGVYTTTITFIASGRF